MNWQPQRLSQPTAVGRTDWSHSKWNQHFDPASPHPDGGTEGGWERDIA